MPVVASLEQGTKLGVGDTAQIELHTSEGKPFSAVLADVENG